MVHQSSSTELRMLSAKEVEAVAGSGTYQYMNGTTLVTEHYDSEGWFTGATYDRADGSGSWFDTTGNSGTWGSSSSAGYLTGGFGAYGLVGGFSYVPGGDLYAYGGLGTPGISGGVGADFDGDLSGWAISAPTPGMTTALIVDPTTGAVTGVEAGRTGLEAYYTVNVFDVGRYFADVAYDAAGAFIQSNYPEPMWNPEYQPQ